MHRNPTTPILYIYVYIYIYIRVVSNSLYDMEYIICRMLYTCSCGFINCRLQHSRKFIQPNKFVSYYMLVSLVFSRNNCKDIVICLVNEGQCDPNVRDNDGEIPLHTACR